MDFFNFFSELKSKCNWSENIVSPYNIVNIGGKIVYIEGQTGLLVLSSDTISCKLQSNKRVEVKGANMLVRELTNSTIIIEGKIYKIEVF